MKAVIFDVDGVLLNNTKVIVKVFQETARKLDVKIPDEKAITSLFGLIWSDIIKILFGNKEKQKIEKIYLETSREHEKEMERMPDIKEVLESIKITKAIVTSKRREVMERQLEGYLHHFKLIITMEDTKKHKPDPEPLLLACKKLNIDPKDCLYVGDTLKDLKMAENAGADFVGILSGSTSKEDFEKAAAKKIISSLSELLRFI